MQPAATSKLRQFPPTQTSSWLQASLQPPQWRGSEETSTHALPHSRSPVPQVLAHTPALQRSGHGLPSMPQWLGSVVRSTQLPVAVSVSPGRQAQVPATQY